MAKLERGLVQKDANHMDELMKLQQKLLIFANSLSSFCSVGQRNRRPCRCLGSPRYRTDSTAKIMAYNFKSNCYHISSKDDWLSRINGWMTG